MLPRVKNNTAELKSSRAWKEEENDGCGGLGSGGHGVLARVLEDGRVLDPLPPLLPPLPPPRPVPLRPLPLPPRSDATTLPSPPLCSQPFLPDPEIPRRHHRRKHTACTLNWLLGRITKTFRCLQASSGLGAAAARALAAEGYHVILGKDILEIYFLSHFREHLIHMYFLSRRYYLTY